MSVRIARGALAPNQGHVCLSCRLQRDSNGAKSAPGEPPKEPEKDDSPVARRGFRDMIRGFMLKNDPARSKTKGSENGNTQDPKAEPKGAENPSSAKSKPPTSSIDLTQQKLQQKFAAQRREQMLAMQADKSSKAGRNEDIPKEPKESPNHHVAAPCPSKPKTKLEKNYGKGRLPGELRRAFVARMKAEQKLPTVRKNENSAQSAGPKDLQREMAEEADVSLVERSLVKKLAGEPAEKNVEENIVDIVEPNTPSSLPQSKGGGEESKKARISSQKKAKSKSKAQDDGQKKDLTEAERKAKLAVQLEPMLRKADGKGLNVRVIQKHPSKDDLIKKHAVGLDLRIRKLHSESLENSNSVDISKFIAKQGAVPRIIKDDRSSKQRKPTSNISDVSGFDSLQTVLNGKGKRSKTDIEKADASKLEILPIEIDQALVPRLSYGLERVLFNPGVYQLQDPRSRVYNFDPYLQKIMPVAEFDFNALKEYITSSKDESLKRIAKTHGKRYVGSTSSMTAALAHFHFLLSQWRPINTSMLSKSFPAHLSSFTQLQRAPSAIFLRWKDGSYAIDADKQFDSANVLSMLGKSMEKLLTLNTEDYERYRKSSPGQVTDEEQLEPETFHYSTMGDFLMRSQLDAHDSRLPGTGMFDLKTRAVVSIRMDVTRYEHGLGYQIKSRQGEWESYEREYYDMIRAAFLKYSMQVRMGRMDGIFVAFHNIERIFGFQYISLPEMDSTIHGQWDTSIGDQEFKLSLNLLNKILDKATQKFPETSIRLHFETRDASTPFMYIFAEPVTEQQVAEIQSQNEAKIEAFNRNILGLHRGEEVESQDTEEDDSKWDNIQADVQEAMDKDELSVNDLSKEYHAEEEEVEDSELGSEEQGVFEEGPLYANKNNSHDSEDATATATGSEANEENGEDGKDAIDEVESDEEVEEQDQEQDEEVDQELTEEEQGNENSDEVEESRENEEFEENAGDDSDVEELVGEEESTGVSEDDSQGSEQSTVATSEDVIAVEDIAEAEDKGESLLDATTDHEATEDHTKAASDAKTKREYVPPMPGAEEEEFPTEADQPFLDSITEELAEADDATSPGQDILAMTLTVRNKVNGKFVLRPERLTAQDSWSIEYSLVEVSSQPRARALYEACQLRRKKRLDTPEVPEEEEVLNQYLLRLRELSAKGKKWRARMDKEDRKKPTQVLGKEIAQSSGEGGVEGL
ncbi:hypothetical protein OEA41_008917 [Lepraria neglecta]|uniref:Uncharacterized protein n=1 Tax=Lepraria neglecta TaxID=209136 RepID=A0AAD9Z2R8_9LECA|nr:hypothetical protein OEA41_008917 [Lepraria neglecta]